MVVCENKIFRREEIYDQRIALKNANEKLAVNIE